MRLLLLLLLLCPAAFAQSTGTLHGRVVDELGDPLLGATVVLEATQIGAATDADGRFLITEIPTGEYEIMVYFVGYRTQVKTVEVISGRVWSIGFELQPMSARELARAWHHGWSDLECGSEEDLISRDPLASRVLSGEEIACLPIER